MIDRMLRPLLAPVPRDGILLTHSAFAGLSRQGVRAEDVLAAMREIISGGTLLFPTMTWRTVTPAAPLFDELATPSHTGILTEIFRTRFAETRSLHPTHSVAGCGPAAAEMLASHHIGTTPCPATSPYGLMRGRPAFILLLGVGMESCTALHHVEESVAPDLYLRPEGEAEDYTLRDRHGRERPYRLRRHLKLQRNFEQFGRMLADGGRMHQGDIGGVPWRLFRLDDLYEAAFPLLRRQPDAILS